MTMQQAPERRPKKIDLNLLPPEYRPPKKSYFGPTLYLIVLILACALAALIVIKLGVDSDITSRNQTLSNLQQQLSQLQTNKAEADAIKAQITTAQNKLEKREADYESFINNRTLWSQILSEITELAPRARITLNSISTTATEVTIKGVATRRSYVLDYVVDMEESDFFNSITFNFGDCPDTEACSFEITASLASGN